MFWIFASVVLALMVYHRGFRLFVLYGSAAVFSIVALALVIWHHHSEPQPVAKYPPAPWEQKATNCQYAPWETVPNGCPKLY